ncbi:hypothetical protein H6CHR_00438 [Variovorax sp. PBL-H6]|uniref:hypothetical protein n=1 Tax=Variovorax sp. PBL-H6 TaxID=434009 RepID=UPI0013163573|nr:hypothetical protein [Variovorax sp. PBL-H6]VTU16109.1 hypothetical protein H6CHR_00438 [Variovorax sp. PBL-H6]
MIFDTRRGERSEHDVAARPMQNTQNTQSRNADARIAPDDLEQPVSRQPEPSRQPRQQEQLQASQVPQRPHTVQQDRADESLAPLFAPEAARDFRASWDAVQIGFVDDPQQAVRQADELVRQMLQNLSQTFSDERAGLDTRGGGAADAASTEKLRVALRRYRAFMQRLLSL